MYIRLIKANKKDWKILRRHDYDTDDGKQYFYIEGPDGIYQDADGNVYHFDTYKNALEELEYLRGEQDEDEKKIKSSNKRFEVVREDLGKSHVYEGADRKFYIFDNIKDESVEDFYTGETKIL